MARVRMIKPGFFLDDALCELPPLARLLFAGLWCIADREGRLEDRPKRIKAEVLPYDDCDVDVLLDELAKHDFIIRYRHGDGRFVQVANFTKHQTPHIKEAASTIQAPDWHGASTIQAPDWHGASTILAPDWHGASTILAPPDTDTDTDTDTEPPPIVPPLTGGGDSVSVDKSVDNCAASSSVSSDWEAKAADLLTAAWFPDKLETLAGLLADENKSGKTRLSKVVRTIYAPLVAAQESFSRDALAYGLEAAIAAGAPNANYVRKAATGYRANGKAPPAYERPEWMQAIVDEEMSQ